MALFQVLTVNFQSVKHIHTATDVTHYVIYRPVEHLIDRNLMPTLLYCEWLQVNGIIVIVAWNLCDKDISYCVPNQISWGTCPPVPRFRRLCLRSPWEPCGYDVQWLRGVDVCRELQTLHFVTGKKEIHRKLHAAVYSMFKNTRIIYNICSIQNITGAIEQKKKQPQSEYWWNNCDKITEKLN